MDKLAASLVAGLMAVAPARAAEPPPEIVRTIAPTGTLRAAINYGNPVLAQRGASGEPGGVSVALARALGQRLGVPVELLPFDGAGRVTEAVRSGAWDVAFLAIDPQRATEITFTQPYVLIEGTYMVADGSPLTTPDAVDRRGVRVSVGQGSAYDLFLTRALTQATLVRAPTSAAAIAAFGRGEVEVAAGVRQPLAAFARTHPGFRVFDGRFMVIEQAMATPHGREAAQAYLRDFLGEMKGSGMVAEALRHSDQEATVAP
ncbi:ABC transporter substrate-binding protein [Methylobacterium sp. J-076]|uniref:ABC transporter substrate-binding protein n=1 Tax=Methylobacterium sp. J-076 TaxID=2836655 RepID=UPI001FB93F2B|nr:ABC transporter substrate-binding protein [Methylobacterium sp. J-076]MCJ2012232.1 ABC transporter substrate-binding protein [Methylobacterium sp. J-076]